MAYIYTITNLINNNQYVGKTSKPNPYDRWKQHLQLARTIDNLQENNSAHSMPILRAICKHGAENFKFRVIEECNDENVSKRETYWIEKLGTYGNNGYNATLGGEGVKRAKKDWANHPNSKAVSCYTLEGEWVRDYDSVGVAADSCGNKKGKSSIVFCIKGKTFQALGYRWAWKGESPKVVENRINVRGNVYGINPLLGRKRMWISQADAAEEIQGNRKNNHGLYHSLNSPNKAKLQVKGWYLFRKKNDALGNWKPATKVQSTEHYKKAAAISNEKRKRPVRAIDIKTGEIIKFNSMSEASFFLKGKGNYTGTSNIIHNIKRIEKGETWCNAYGYRWYYD
jgi:group I intron endonuclease